MSTTVHAKITRLPHVPKVQHLESPECYLRRLGDANGLPHEWVRQELQRRHGTSSKAQWAGSAALAEQLAGMAPGSFERMIEHAVPTSLRGGPSRFGCLRCTGGLAIQQVPHYGHQVCRKHRRWIGYYTDPSSQFDLEADDEDEYVLAAKEEDEHWATGRLSKKDLHRAESLILKLSPSTQFDLVRANVDLPRGSWEAGRFPMTLRVALALSDHTLIQHILDPGTSFEEAQEHVQLAADLSDDVSSEVLAADFLADFRYDRMRASMWDRDPEWAVPLDVGESDLRWIDTAEWESTNLRHRPLPKNWRQHRPRPW